MSVASIPVTMLSGFLGVGKTTILRELLSQTKLRVGCIVNDVAAVNIDAKLIRNQQFGPNAEANPGIKELAPTVELENGCACCSIQDELMQSFEQLLTVCDRNGKPFDRIVLENSGVAEPRNIRDKFAEAVELGNPLMRRIHLSTLVTVVDSATFIKDFSCRNALATRPDLGGNGSAQPVVSLLVEQVEIADYVVLNKVDLLGEARVPELTAIIQTINPLCDVVSCSHGKVDLDQVFGANTRELLAKMNVDGQHRGYVSSVRREQATDGHQHAADGHAGKGHGEAGGHAGHHACDKDHEHGPECEHGHGHSHGHSHGHGHGHSDGHAHDDHHGHACTKDHVHGPDCSAHTHACTKDHVHGPECGEAAAKKDRTWTTARDRFGITSFVYSRRRPFHPQRLRELLVTAMPPPPKASKGGAEPAPRPPSAMTTVLRSKGFVWLSSGHAHAYYWSHAGQHFEIVEEGNWWAAVPDEDWPTAAASRAVVISDFLADFPYGDRRQEIVFIGTNMDQPAIESLLDSALLTDDEMAKYDANWASLPDPTHAGVPLASSAAP